MYEHDWKNQKNLLLVHESVGAIQSTQALVHQLQYTGCGLESSQRERNGTQDKGVGHATRVQLCYSTIQGEDQRQGRKRYGESQVEHQLPVLSKSQSTPARVCYIYGTGYIHFNLTGIKRVYLITWTLLYLNNLQGKLLYLLQGVI